MLVASDPVEGKGDVAVVDEIEALIANAPIYGLSDDEGLAGRCARQRHVSALQGPPRRPSASGSARLTYYLTPAGCRVAHSLLPGPPLRRSKSVGTFLIRHALMTAEAALAFRRAAGLHAAHEVVGWECEWQAALRLGASAVVPDAYLVYAVAGRRLHAFLEVDLGTEHSAFFAGKIRRYLALYRSGNWRPRLPVWPLVLVVAENAARVGHLRRVCETVLSSQPDAPRLAGRAAFHFASIGDLLGPTGPFGEIWEVTGHVERAALIPGLEDSASADARRGATSRA